MKKLILALLLLNINAFAQIATGLDKDNGLPDAHFGSPFKSFKNMKLKNEDRGFKVYTRSSDKLVLEKCKATEIVYRFYNDTLFAIGITVKDMSNAKQLRDYGKKHYGPGEDGTKLNSCAWTGKKTQAVYMESPKKTDATLSIGSKEFGPKRSK